MPHDDPMSRVKDATTDKSELSSVTGADKAAFVHRLQTILAHWPSADRFARAMNVSPSAFRKWLKGEAEPSRERLIALARTAGVGVAWLAEGKGPEPAFESTGVTRRRAGLADPGDSSDWTHFIVLPDQTSPPGTGAPNLGRFLALRQDWVRTVCGVEPENLVLDVAVDEAMTPTIRPRDTLLLDTTESRIARNGIYALGIVGQQRQIRRVQVRHDGSLLLISDNPAYHPDIVTTDTVAALTVFGRVVWVGHTV